MSLVVLESANYLHTGVIIQFQACAIDPVWVVEFYYDFFFYAYSFESMLEIFAFILMFMAFESLKKKITFVWFLKDIYLFTLSASSLQPLKSNDLTVQYLMS